MEQGLGKRGKAATKESQEILRKHGIDPLEGQENMIWAPNWGHKDQMAVDIRDRLKAADESGGDIKEVLEGAGRDYLAGLWRD